MRVLWVVIDALCVDKVTPELMPTLCELGADGWSGSALGVLPATTYPNHATLVTGAAPSRHGLYANEVLVDREWVAAGSVGPSVPTVFEHLGTKGVTTAAVFGDQNLVGVCAAQRASGHWPSGGVAPEGVPLGPTGYAADSATLAAALEMDLGDHGFAMVQLDENDAVSHVHGPDSPEARRHASAVDAVLGELLEPYRPVWSDTVVVVVSDHSQERVEHSCAEAFAEACSSEFGDPAGDGETGWYTDGTCAVVRTTASASDGVRRRLEAIEVLSEVTETAPGVFCVSGGPGVLLGLDWGQRGDHGASRCRTQVAVLGGGHGAVASLAGRLGASPIDSRSWAPLTLSLFEGA